MNLILNSRMHEKLLPEQWNMYWRRWWSKVPLLEWLHWRILWKWWVSRQYIINLEVLGKIQTVYSKDRYLFSKNFHIRKLQWALWYRRQSTQVWVCTFTLRSKYYLCTQNFNTRGSICSVKVWFFWRSCYNWLYGSIITIVWWRQYHHYHNWWQALRQ